MRIFLYILIIGISTLISCSGSPDPLYPRYTTFPDEKMVATQEISIDSAFFRYPYRVAVKDSIAIIMDYIMTAITFTLLLIRSVSRSHRSESVERPPEKCFRQRCSSFLHWIQSGHWMLTGC